MTLNKEFKMLRPDEIVVDNFAGGGASTGTELGLNR